MSTVNVLIFTGTFHGHVKPAGAYRIATELRKQGYTVQVVDQFPQLIEEGSEKLLTLIDKFVGANTLWVGFSSTFLLDRRAARRARAQGMSSAEVDDNKNVFMGNIIPLTGPELVALRKKIKANGGDKCKIVLGGSRAHLRAGGIIDVFIEGYADTTVMQFTKWCEGKNPFLRYETNPGSPLRVPSISITHDPKASNFDFNTSVIEWTAQDVVDQGEALPIEIARGCIFSCSFCSYPLNGKKKLDFIKDPAVLRAELTRNYELWGTTQYIYADDTHNDSKDKLHLLYDEVYSKLPFKIGFYTYLRVDLLAAHPETIKLLHESGLRGAFFGIESLHYESAKAIGKGIRTEKAIDTLTLARQTWGTDVKTSAGFIVGLPNETRETARTWLDRIVQPDFPLDCVHIYPLTIASNPGTKVWKSELETNPEKYGYTFDPHPKHNGLWRNQHMAYADAHDLVREYLIKARTNRKRLISDFAIPGLLGLGLSWDDLHNVQAEDLANDDMRTRFEAKADRYYQSLLAL